MRNKYTYMIACLERVHSNFHVLWPLGNNPLIEIVLRYCRRNTFLEFLMEEKRVWNKNNCSISHVFVKLSVKVYQ